MKRIIVAMIAIGAFALVGTPAAAQQTTGNIQGRITDAQKAAVPGVTVTAKSAATGFTRTEVSDSEGVYRLNALPVGTYDLVADLPGFTRVERKEIAVDVSETTNLLQGRMCVAAVPAVPDSRIRCRTSPCVEGALWFLNVARGLPGCQDGSGSGTGSGTGSAGDWTASPGYILTPPYAAGVNRRLTVSSASPMIMPIWFHAIP